MPIWDPGCEFRPGGFTVSVAPTQGYSVQNIVSNYEVILPDGRAIPLSRILTQQDIEDIQALIAQAGAVIMQKIMIEKEGLTKLWVPTVNPTEDGQVVDEATVLEV